jgi:hypothetical protein
LAGIASLELPFKREKSVQRDTISREFRKRKAVKEIQQAWEPARPEANPGARSFPRKRE